MLPHRSLPTRGEGCQVIVVYSLYPTASYVRLSQRWTCIGGLLRLGSKGGGKVPDRLMAWSSRHVENALTHIEASPVLIAKFVAAIPHLHFAWNRVRVYIARPRTECKRPPVRLAIAAFEEVLILSDCTATRRIALKVCYRL